MQYCCYVIAEAEMSVEHTWVLGLALKALNFILSVSWTTRDYETLSLDHLILFYVPMLCTLHGLQFKHLYLCVCAPPITITPFRPKALRMW